MLRGSDWPPLAWTPGGDGSGVVLAAYATYDDGHEGNDYCVGNCGQSTTETGPGSPGYTGYTPPPTAPSAPRTGTPASSTPVVSQPRPGMPTAALWFELTHPFRPGAFTVLPYGEVNAWDPVLQLACGRLKGSRGRAILEAHDFTYAGFLDLFNVVDLEYHGRDPVAYDADFWTGAWSPNVYLTDRDRQIMDRYPELIAGSGGTDPGRLLAMLSLVGAGGSDRGTAPGGTRLGSGGGAVSRLSDRGPAAGSRRPPRSAGRRTANWTSAQRTGATTVRFPGRGCDRTRFTSSFASCLSSSRNGGRRSAVVCANSPSTLMPSTGRIPGRPHGQVR